MNLIRILINRSAGANPNAREADMGEQRSLAYAKSSYAARILIDEGGDIIGS
jgi:hypothetical protein